MLMIALYDVDKQMCDYLPFVDEVILMTQDASFSISINWSKTLVCAESVYHANVYLREKFLSQSASCINS